MGLRFRRSVKIAPGVKINFNKKSTGVTFGGKGVHYTVNSSGKKTASVGIPGTGLYYTESTTTKKKPQKKTKQVLKEPFKEATKDNPTYSPKTYKVCGIILLTISIITTLLALISISVGGWFLLIISIPLILVGIQFIKISKQR